MRVIELEEILSIECNAMLVPSSAYLTFESGWRVAYVNDGIGGRIANLYPSIRHTMDALIETAGNTVGLLTGLNGWRSVPNLGEYDDIAPYHLLNFPVKPGYVYLWEDGLSSLEAKYRHQAAEFPDGRVPGYMSKIRMGIVEESVKELITFVDETDWTQIACPKFREEKVNEYLKRMLDDRFVLVCQTQP